jgi:uncharacterized protein (UPF0335 family)
MNHSDEAAAVLRGFVERIRELDAVTHEISRELRGVYLEAKSSGFNIRALKQIARSHPDEARGDAGAALAYLRVLGGDALAQRLGKEELDTDEKAHRAWSYATQHETDIPKLRDRMDELERKFTALVDFVNRNMAKNDGQPRGA